MQPWFGRSYFMSYGMDMLFLVCVEMQLLFAVYPILLEIDIASDTRDEATRGQHQIC